MRSCLLTLKDLRPISKKNSKRWLMRGRRPFLIPSEAYEKFEKEALFQIRNQLGADFKTFDQPVSATYNFVLKGRIKADVDNLISGINDILEKAGVVSDDDFIVCGAFSKSQGAPDWTTYIEIEDFPLDKQPHSLI